MPTPRKLRAASAKMAPPRLMVATTTRGAKVCGDMCRRTIRDGREPMARADSTYSASFADQDYRPYDPCSAGRLRHRYRNDHRRKTGAQGHQ